MTAVTEPGYYDTDLADPASLALLPLGDSPWLPVYREASMWIRPHEQVVDLGCGTGRFAYLLSCEPREAPYLGVDFSAVAVTEARRYVNDYRFEFEVADLREWEAGQVAGNTVFVCLEVLEHLEDDRGLIAQLEAGSRLVFSVPTYPSDSHQRHFADPAAVRERYGLLLGFTRWSFVGLGPPDGRGIHLFDSRRRADQW